LDVAIIMLVFRIMGRGFSNAVFRIMGRGYNNASFYVNGA